jgi:hypothetical protein
MKKFIIFLLPLFYVATTNAQILADADFDPQAMTTSYRGNVDANHEFPKTDIENGGVSKSGLRFVKFKKMGFVVGYLSRTIEVYDLKGVQRNDYKIFKVKAFPLQNNAVRMKEIIYFADAELSIFFTSDFQTVTGYRLQFFGESGKLASVTEGAVGCF